MKVNKNILKNFEKLKVKINGWDEGIQEGLTDLPIVGDLSWNKPHKVLWIHAIINEEGYEGSTNQFGISKEGKIVWGYFGHCSCYGYEDYKGDFKELKKEDYKEYELSSVDEEIEFIIKDKLNKISRMIREGEL